MMSQAFQYFYSPLGLLVLIAQNDSLIKISWNKDLSQLGLRSDQLDKKNKVLCQTQNQLCEYFLGKRQSFSIKLAPHGTDFQKKTWKVLQDIHYGQTISYSQEALHMGGANMARAVAGANGKNPIPIIIPCHRVIGKDGNLVGFTGGLEKKKFLLGLEGSYFNSCAQQLHLL